MILIKLTTTESRDIWVNPDYIASISSGDNCACVYVANDSYPVKVKEKVEEILQKITVAYQ